MMQRFQNDLFSEPEDELGERVSRALETVPSIAIPPGFAARTAALAGNLAAPAELRVKTSAGYTRVAIAVALAGLTVAMIGLGAIVEGSTRQMIPFGGELLLAVEFVALTTWVSLRRADLF